jgi:hypothetical protein
MIFKILLSLNLKIILLHLFIILKYSIIHLLISSFNYLTNQKLFIVKFKFIQILAQMLIIHYQLILIII